MKKLLSIFCLDYKCTILSLSVFQTDAVVITVYKLVVHVYVINSRIEYRNEMMPHDELQGMAHWAIAIGFTTLPLSGINWAKQQ